MNKYYQNWDNLTPLDNDSTSLDMHVNKMTWVYIKNHYVNILKKKNLPLLN